MAGEILASPRRTLVRESALLNRGLLENVDAARGPQADHVGESDLGVRDLTIAGLSPKVMTDLPDVGDTGGRDRVAFGLQTARHIHRCRAVPPGGARAEKV